MESVHIASPFLSPPFVTQSPLVITTSLGTFEESSPFEPVFNLLAQRFLDVPSELRVIYPSSLWLPTKPTSPPRISNSPHSHAAHSHILHSADSESHRDGLCCRHRLGFKKPGCS